MFTSQPGTVTWKWVNTYIYPKRSIILSNNPNVFNFIIKHNELRQGLIVVYYGDVYLGPLRTEKERDKLDKFDDFCSVEGMEKLINEKINREVNLK